MSTPTVDEVREAGEFAVVSDALIEGNILDAVEYVDAKILERRHADSGFVISDRQYAQLVKWRACDLTSITERRFISESGDGLSGTYENQAGRFARQFEEVWGQVLGGVKTLFTAGENI